MTFTDSHTAVQVSWYGTAMPREKSWRKSEDGEASVKELTVLFPGDIMTATSREQIHRCAATGKGGLSWC